MKDNYKLQIPNHLTNTFLFTFGIMYLLNLIVRGLSDVVRIGIMIIFYMSKL